MISQKYTITQISKSLNEDKSLVSYYVKKAIGQSYVKEIGRDMVKRLELTQAGKNFLEQYTNNSLNNIHSHTCRLENIRFKAPVHRMPTIMVDWNKVEMNNWIQYGSEIDNIKVHLNDGKSPTIEFIPSAIDGDDHYSLFAMALYDCHKAAEKLEETLGMEIGRLEPSSRAEWIVYDPVAKEYSKHIGQVTVDDIGKVNASKPRRIGELEFFDPRDAAGYMAMPRRLYDIEQNVREIVNLLKQQRNSNSSSLGEGSN